MKSITIKDILLFLLIIVGFAYLKSCGDKPIPQIIDIPKPKNIINNIKAKENTIHTIEKQIYNKQEVEKMLVSFKQELFLQLDSLKRKQDLPSVVRIQDSIIRIQGQEIDNLHGVISDKDSIINIQRYIIDSKDTLLSISEAQAKKLKKQRNWLALAAILEGGVIILK